MSFTLDKRILRTLIAAVGLIASGAVIAECPDPVGRWAGTFQTYNGEDGTQSESVLAVRLRADGSMKWTMAYFTQTDGSSSEGSGESSGEGIWHIDMMTGSCMLRAWMRHGLSPMIYGPFVDRRTVKAVVWTPVDPEYSVTGQGTLHKVSFLR